jgi:hypothetical protein
MASQLLQLEVMLHLAIVLAVPCIYLYGAGQYQQAQGTVVLRLVRLSLGLGLAESRLQTG